MNSRWAFLRRSTIDRNAITRGLRPGIPSTKSMSWSKVRTESIAGISGTSRTSQAWTTFSDTRDTLGGQSRMTRS